MKYIVVYNYSEQSYDVIQKMKIFCILCKQDTNHEVLKEKIKDHGSPEDEIWAEGKYQIIKCNGCDSISFREVWVHSEDYNFETGELTEFIKLYPLRGKQTLTVKDYDNTPQNIRSIYRETIDAFNSGLYILTAGGLRAIIEGICMEEKIKDGPVESTDNSGNITIKRRNNLEGKISGLREKGLLSRDHAEMLHENRFMGNKALHTLNKPSINELMLAIEIVEHTLDNLYEIPCKIAESRFKRRLRERKK